MYEFTDGKHIIVEKVTIERSPADVFDFLTVADNISLFWSNLIEYEHLFETLEKGARSRATQRIAGKKLEWTAEIVELEQDELIRWRSIEAPVDFEFEYRFEPVGAGTEVTYWLETDDRPGFFAGLADAVVGRMMSREVHGYLLHLKDLLEAGVDR